jgi:hypothetical protein
VAVRGAGPGRLDLNLRSRYSRPHPPDRHRRVDYSEDRLICQQP